MAMNPAQPDEKNGESALGTRSIATFASAARRG